MIEDYLLGAGASVITASAIVLVILLSRYRSLVQDADRSSQLAKDLWDAMNSRLSVMDLRIVDLMAKVDVKVIRDGAKIPSTSSPSRSALEQTTRSEKVESQPNTALTGPPQMETSGHILRILADGPKTSGQIRDMIERSREHTARLMKELYNRGLVLRNERNKPYVYEITDAGKRYLSGN